MIAALSVPTRHPLRVHATVPAALAVTGRVSAWARRERGVDAPPAFLEGPVLDGHGGLYLVDVAWGRILHVTAAGEFSVVVEYDGEPNGLARLDEDRLLVADFRRGLMLIEDVRSATPKARVLLEDAGGEPFHGLNDLVVTAGGAVYVTDQGDTGLHDATGRLFRLPPGVARPDRHQHQQPGGQQLVGLATLLDAIPSPNGLVVDDAENTVYLAVTRDNAVWRVPIGPHGPRKVGRFIQLSGGVGPDGLARGPAGTLLVAHLGMGVVWVYDDRGVPLLALEAPAGRAVTNVCVAADGRVYVTESETSTVLTADLGELLGELPGASLSAWPDQHTGKEPR